MLSSRRQSSHLVLREKMYLYEESRTYILLHVFLPGLHGRLSYLEPHLRSWIIHEVETLTKTAAAAAATASCWRGLIWIPVSVHLWLLRALLGDRRRG